MDAAAPRVLVADGQRISRLGLRTALRQAGTEVVDDVGSAAEAVASAVAHRPHVCVLDLSVRGDGIAAVRQIKQELPDTVVIVLTGSPNTKELVSALSARASAYVPNALEPGALAAIVRAALAGSAAIPVSLVGALVADAPGRDRRRRRRIERQLDVRLTSREWEVMELLGQGFSIHEIATELGVSIVTVRRHTSEVVRRLDVRDRHSALEVLRSAGF